MCGRFTFLDPSNVAEEFGLSLPIPELAPRYYAAPSQTIAVIALKRGAGERGLALLKWGLVPSWAKRCLIPADGFYEWAAVGGKKRATHFHLKDRSLFAFAGLWEF